MRLSSCGCRALQRDRCARVATRRNRGGDVEVEPPEEPVELTWERDHWAKRHQGYLVLAIVLIFVVPFFVYQQRQSEARYKAGLNAIYVAQLSRCTAGQGTRKAVYDNAVSLQILQGVANEVVGSALAVRKTAAHDPETPKATRKEQQAGIKLFENILLRIANHPIRLPPGAIDCKKSVPDPNHLAKIAEHTPIPKKGT